MPGRRVSSSALASVAIPARAGRFALNHGTFYTPPEPALAILNTTDGGVAAPGKHVICLCVYVGRSGVGWGILPAGLH